MKVSVSVMAHPQRQAEVDLLLAGLGDAVPIAWDEEGPASGNHDRVWRNCRKAWEMHDHDADWHVVLQDDANVCSDLLAALPVALGHAPQMGAAIVSLYLGDGRAVPRRWDVLAEKANARGAAWVRTLKLMWGVAIAIPVPLIPEMIEAGNRKANVPDDMRISGWAERSKREVWYSWPSLVDHRPVPSLTKHNASDRRARRHWEGSALAIDWSGPVLTDPIVEIRGGVRSGPSRRRQLNMH